MYLNLRRNTSNSGGQKFKLKTEKSPTCNKQTKPPDLKTTNSTSSNILAKLMLATKKVCNNLNGPKVNQSDQLARSSSRRSNHLQRDGSMDKKPAARWPSCGHKSAEKSHHQLGSILRRSISLNRRQRPQQQQQVNITDRFQRISSGSLRLVANNLNNLNTKSRKSQTAGAWAARRSLSCQSIKQRKSKVASEQPEARMSLLKLAKQKTKKQKSGESVLRHLINRRPSAGRPSWLQTLLFIVINALLVLSLHQPQVGLAAPLALYGRPAEAQQSQPARSIWLSDGLLTVEPTNGDTDIIQEDTQVDDVDQVAPDHLLINTQPVAADKTALDSLLLSDYIEAANEQQQQQQQQQQPSTEFVQVKPRRNWFSLQSEPADQQVMDHSEQQQPPEEEMLWIQRRRLNRDRALEPPAWLRERPIRRDDGINLMAEVEPESDKPTADAAVQPIKSRTIRGRQLRQSNELYDEILKHLIEEALDSRDFLEDLYNELESRLSKTSSSGKLNLDSGPTLSMANAAARLVALNEGEAPLVGQKSAASAGDDSTLVVVNDEVSETNNEDIGLLEQQNQAQSERLLDSMIGGSQQSQRPEQLILQKQLADLIGQQSAKSLADQRKSNLIELLQTNVNPNQQSDQFHVVEDIDQLDQTSQTSQATQTGSGVLLDMNKQQLVEEYQPVVGDFAQEDADEASSLRKREVNYLFNEQQQETDNSDDSTDTNNNENQDEEVEFNNQEELLVVPMRKSAAFIRPRTMERRQQMRPPTSMLSQRRPPAGAKNNTSAQLMSLAIKLIQSNYYSRRQLIQLGNKVKYYLEGLIGLPRDSIVGLFPVSSQQLLIELDQSKLSVRDRFDLIQNFNYNRGSVLMDWPQGSQQNPVPILRAVLGALKQQQQQEDANNVATNDGDDDRDDDVATTLPEAQLAALEEAGEAEPANQRPTPTAGGRPLLVAMSPMLVALSSAADQPSRYSSAPNADELTMEETEADDGYLPYGGQQLNQFDGSFQERWQVASTAPDSINNGRQFAALLAYLAAIRRQQEPLVSGATAALLQRQKQRKIDDQRAFYVHLVAVLIALAGSLVILKLIMRRTDGQVLRMRLSRAGGSFRSLWSSPSSDSGGGGGGDDDDDDKQSMSKNHKEPKNVLTSSALVVGEKGKHLNELEAGNFARRFSNDSGLDTIVGTEDGKSSKAGLVSTKHLDQLSHRLMTVLSFGSTKHNGKQAGKADLESNDTETTGSNKPFRTSRSYIKSLIDVLTKTRSDVSAANDEPTSSTSNKDDFDEDDNSESQLMSSKRQQQQQQQVSEAAGGGIIVSQMDISAAHLILDYMEKHLDDKERLRREWLELNAINQQQQQQNRSKANQLVLQRLAKVALLEENRDKNRNPGVVPFDRNRVRLRTGVNYNNSNNNSTGVKQRTNTRNKQALKLKRRTQTSDYINASFIYDDDPRSPTHIIAQGPNEQTIGQFWQMIWEQEVSVIVMLTRLNENGQQMCHCYWPTGASGPGEQPALGSPKQLDQESGPGKSPGGRRGSVTSVFSASALARPTNTTAIIAANDDLDDNVLYFEVGSSQPLRGQSPPIDEEKSSSFSDYDDDDDGADDHDNDNHKENKPKSMKLEVHLISEHVSSNDYLVRNMYLINRSTGETRTISQFHYLAWPENRTPDNVRSLLQFRRLVLKSYRNLKSPILVHCSDGAGRSGTYTLLDLILERIRNGAKEIDPRATLEHLRDQRIGLCATQSQFEFVLVALAEEIQIILNALPK